MHWWLSRQGRWPARPGLYHALERVVCRKIGAGDQFAVSPTYRANPLTPSCRHAGLFTTRFNF